MSVNHKELVKANFVHHYSQSMYWTFLKYETQQYLGGLSDPTYLNNKKIQSEFFLKEKYNLSILDIMIINWFEKNFQDKLSNPDRLVLFEKTISFMIGHYLRYYSNEEIYHHPATFSGFGEIVGKKYILKLITNFFLKMDKNTYEKFNHYIVNNKSEIFEKYYPLFKKYNHLSHKGIFECLIYRFELLTSLDFNRINKINYQAYWYEIYYYHNPLLAVDLQKRFNKMNFIETLKK